MKRFLFLVLLCVLPLQSSLAAVAEYCTHDSREVQTAHPGHHEHDGQKQKQKQSKKAPNSSVPQAGLDCAHHCFPVLVPSFAEPGAMDLRKTYSPDLGSDFQSAVPVPTERPPLLAHA